MQFPNFVDKYFLAVSFLWQLLMPTFRVQGFQFSSHNEQKNKSFLNSFQVMKQLLFLLSVYFCGFFGVCFVVFFGIRNKNRSFSMNIDCLKSDLYDMQKREVDS